VQHAPYLGDEWGVSELRPARRPTTEEAERRSQLPVLVQAYAEAGGTDQDRGDISHTLTLRNSVARRFSHLETTRRRSHNRQLSKDFTKTVFRKI
jgi:hypothetical protein